MKVFLSWSGQLSKKIAELLNEYIPSFIQTAEIFFSPEDIEKGENWDKRLTDELSTCNYGIICLTEANKAMPWINFEEGAIARALDSRVATLVADIKPSDIQGPLKRYQATSIVKEDFLQLISNINKQCDPSVPSMALERTFNGLWPDFYQKIKDILSQEPTTSSAPDSSEETDPIEEILQLLRKQNILLSSPEQLLPMPYVRSVMRAAPMASRRSVALFEEIASEVEHIICDNTADASLHSIRINLRHILVALQGYAGRYLNPASSDRITQLYREYQCRYARQRPVSYDDVDSISTRLIINRTCDNEDRPDTPAIESQTDTQS